MNKNVRKVVMTSAIIGALSLSALTGCSCNKQIMDFKYSFNKAIIFNGDTATIIEIQKWNDYDGEQIQLITKDGAVIVTSSFDTKLINDVDSDIKAEDIARAIIGDDAEINYLDKEHTLTLRKDN